MRETSVFGADSYRAGDNWVVCDLCGFKYRRSEVRLRWDGAVVCHKDWEPRHPQEFVRGVKEKAGVDLARPDPEVITIDTPVTQDDL